MGRAGREGPRAAPAGAGNMAAAFSHTYQPVSSGLVRLENETATRIGYQPIRSWKGKEDSNKGRVRGVRPG